MFVLFEEFWILFEKTWNDDYDPEIWNVHRVLEMNDYTSIMINRTNNPLESFNAKLNSKLCTAHPKMINFIDIIKDQSNTYVVENDLVLKNEYFKLIF